MHSKLLQLDFAEPSNDLFSGMVEGVGQAEGIGSIREAVTLITIQKGSQNYYNIIKPLK